MARARLEPATPGTESDSSNRYTTKQPLPWVSQLQVLVDWLAPLPSDACIHSTLTITIP